jgi:tetratricopeptide (TPR) repeat protein
VELISATAGRYLLRLSSKAEDDDARPCEIRIEEWRAATASDQARLAWQRAFIDGADLVAKRTPEAYRQAAEKFQEAAQLAREMQDRMREGDALHRLGYCFLSLRELQRALDYFQQAREIFQAAGDGYRETNALMRLGDLKISLGERQQASEFFQRSLLLARSVKNLDVEAFTRLYLHSIHESLGEYDKSVEDLQRGLRLIRLKGRQADTTPFLRNLIPLCAKLGEARLALESAHQLLQFYQARKLTPPCEILRNIGFLSTAS